MFKVAGVSRLKGEFKVRFANDLVARIKILTKAGATDINLVELPKPMNKVQAMAFLQKQGITAALPTRSKSGKKSELVIAAEKLVEKGRKISESRARNKAAATGNETPVVAVETPAPVQPVAEPIAA